MDKSSQCLGAKRPRGTILLNEFRKPFFPVRGASMLAMSFSAFLTVATGTLPAVAQSAAEVKTVQRHLFGYGLRTFDGTFNAETENVIAAYEKDWGLPVTGKISEELILRLTRQHPDTRPRWQPVAGSDCKLWNEHPNAQEKITWSGGCKNGKVHGKGGIAVDVHAAR
ncbi:MAG: peptidoglycan-binding domain-containing protein [Hyphomicrobiales bacterium]